MSETIEGLQMKLEEKEQEIIVLKAQNKNISESAQRWLDKLEEVQIRLAEEQGRTKHGTPVNNMPAHEAEEYGKRYFRIVFYIEEQDENMAESLMQILLENQANPDAYTMQEVN